MPITNLIRDNWRRFQGELFPEIQDAVSPLLKNHQRFVMALGIICPEDFTLRISQRDRRPLCDRINLVRALIAGAIPVWQAWQPSPFALRPHCGKGRVLQFGLEVVKSH